MKEVSVVTVCYNCVDVIEETIKSVISQNRSLYEYLVIDGKSNDGTVQLINKYKSGIDVFISEPDNGIFDAMNKAIDIASGKWILFMNAGDVFADNNVLYDVFGNIKYPNNIGVIYGDVIFKGNDCITKQESPFYLNNKEIKQMGICHQTIFTRTDLAKSTKFDCRYKYTADYNMMYQIYKKQYDFFHINRAVAIYDLSGASSANPFAQLKEIAIILDKTNSMAYYFAKIELIKRIIKKIIKNFIKNIYDSQNYSLLLVWW